MPIGSSAPPNRLRRLRLRALGSILLILGFVALCYYPLPDPYGETAPTYLERVWFRLTATQPPRDPDVIFVPTPQTAVDRMLELAELKPTDKLYDLGCGDGRIVVTAAKKYGVRAVGVDINPLRVVESERNVKTNGVADLVTILKADIFDLDFSDATVVTLYLLPELNVRLMPKLAQLRPGARILSFDFNMRGARPLAIVKVPGQSGVESHRIFKWIVPWEPE